MEITGQSTQQAVNTAPDASSVDALISTIGGPQAPPEGFNEDAFKADFKRVTGLEDPAQVKELLPLKEKYAKAQQRLAELEQRANINPFANELAKHVNEQFRAGKTVNDIIPFLTLQSQDFNAMEPSEVVKWNKRMETGWGEAKVNDWFEIEYPGVDEDAEDAVKLKKARDFKIEDAAQKAREALNGKKVEIGRPDPNIEARKQQQKIYIDNVARVAGAVVDSIKTIPVSLKDEAIGLDYSLNYTPSLDEATRKSVIDTVVQDYAGRGLPLDEQGLQQIKGTAEKIIRYLTADDREQAIIRDAYASMSENQIKRVTNTKPTPKGVTPAPKQVQKVQPIVKVGGRTFA